MPGSEPSTETVDLTGARAQWSALIEAVAGGRHRVIVERNGAPIAAIVSADDLLRLQRLEQERERSFAALYESQAAFADLPDEEVQREVEKALAEVRDERRAEAKRVASRR